MKILKPMLQGIAVMLFAGLLGAVPAHAELKVGDKAPDFTMKGSDGKTYKLSELCRERAVVVAWYPKAFTGG